MKNPHITNTLIQIMQSDRALKLDLIGSIINHCKESNPLYDECNAFNTLYELQISELNVIIGECINDKWNDIYKTLVKNYKGPEDDNC